MNAHQFFRCRSPWRQLNVIHNTAFILTAQLISMIIHKHFGQIEKFWDQLLYNRIVNIHKNQYTHINTEESSYKNKNAYFHIRRISLAVFPG